MQLPQEYFDDPDFQRMEAVFHDYVAQGDGRNPTWVSHKTGLPLAKVCTGMVKGAWLARINQIGVDAAKQARNEVLVGDVAGLNSRDVATLTAFIELTDVKLAQAIERDEVPPAILWKINETARQRRRETLGLGPGQEGDLASKMAKLLEASTSDKPEEAKPFLLDHKKLETPPELPAMPGMTSDGLEEETDENGETGDRGEQT